MRIQDVRPELTRLMTDAQLVDECAFAIPRKIGGEIGERDVFVRERSKRSGPDDVRPKVLGAEIHRTGDFDQRGRIEVHIFEELSGTESRKKCFQIEAALNLEFGGVAFPIPIAIAGETAPGVAPLAMRDIQPLVVPFCGSGEVSNFVAAALQSLSTHRRLDSSLFDFRDVSAELHLQRRRSRWEPELFPFTNHALCDRYSLLPFFRGERWRSLIILSLDKLPSRRDPNSTKNSFRLTDVNFFGRKVNVCAKIGQLWPADFPFGCLEWKSNF